MKSDTERNTSPVTTAFGFFSFGVRANHAATFPRNGFRRKLKKKKHG
jgi:hypothetical protein